MAMIRLGSRSRLIQLLALATLLGAVIWVQTPPGPIFLHVLQKFGHPVVFGLCALLILALRRSATPERAPVFSDFVKAFALTIACGAATELAQGFTHRDPSEFDVLRDSLGALTALSGQWYWKLRKATPMRARSTRTGAALVCALGCAVVSGPLLFCVAAYANRDLRFPVLWQYSSRLDLYFLDAEACESPTVAPFRAVGEASAAFCIKLSSGEASPGFSLREPYPDWRGRSLLMIDLTNPNGHPLQLTLRVHDRSHNEEYEDRFNRGYSIAAGARRVIAVPLKAIAVAPRGRRMDLQHVVHIGVFRSEGTGTEALLLRRIWLQ